MALYFSLSLQPIWFKILYLVLLSYVKNLLRHHNFILFNTTYRILLTFLRNTNCVFNRHWYFQIIGHKILGKMPSFFQMMTFNQHNNYIIIKRTHKPTLVDILHCVSIFYGKCKLFICISKVKNGDKT